MEKRGPQGLLVLKYKPHLIQYVGQPMNFPADPCIVQETKNFFLALLL